MHEAFDGSGVYRAQSVESSGQETLSVNRASFAAGNLLGLFGVLL